MNHYKLIRHILFALPPEVAHTVTMESLKHVTKLGIKLAPQVKNTPVSLLGLTFPNRLGVAAGLDKNGDYVEGLVNLGFGFIELGTVTPRPQTGNKKPRLFRLPKAEAIINRMGFNNKGVDYLVQQLQKIPRSPAKIGINLGKNADIPLERALDDYVYGLKTAYHWADYITINISSPNTPGLRDLHHGSALVELLQALKQLQQELSAFTQTYKPILVKIAPDLTDEQIKVIAEQVVKSNLDGIIATNTTINRADVEYLVHGKETGGLSGAPLTGQSTHVLKVLRQTLGRDFPIISVGGIMSAADAKEKLDAGADLLQVYTGLIYKGPVLIKELLEI